MSSRDAAAAPATRKLTRCAIYTRKSTEHNLDLEFNSLDAQRESCEAYIKSQAHEGWRLIPDHYDDGGLSGASLDRAALQTLLVDLQAGKIDVVVVYKVDRLTRSLADFAKLVELFDRHEVSFVSVTQSFNTTSSMGRLTLNVLLSFAQFEREVIGERVRDKIAASKRKGLWVGGPVPLGYASINKKLVVVAEEAETVREIFRRYLKLGSVGALVEDLDRAGIRTKRRVLSSGRVVGGGRFGMGALAHFLRNRFYVGDVDYRGEIYSGDHESILDRDLFDAVQAKLTSNAVERRILTRGSSALLTGRLFDEQGNRMTPSHATKQHVRYRYYVSQAVLQRKARKIGQVTRVPAPEIETLVLHALRAHLNDNVAAPPEATEDRDLVERNIERVVIKGDAIEIVLSGQSAIRKDINNRDSYPCDQGGGEQPPIVLDLPWATREPVAAKGVANEPKQPALKAETQEGLLTAIAKARSWVDDIVHGRTGSLAEIARREGKVERHIRLLIALAFVSPTCVRKVMSGTVPTALTVTGLARALPHSWAVQGDWIDISN